MSSAGDLSGAKDRVLLLVHGRDFKPSAEDFMDLSLAAIAKHTGLSESYARARFKEQFFEGKDGELKTRLVLPLELPGKWRKVGEMEYSTLESKDGWLTVSWNRKPKEKQAAKPSDPVVKNVDSQESKVDSQS